MQHKSITPRICAVPGCDAPVKQCNMCGRHYQRVRITGMTDLRPRPTPEERFWAKVDRKSPDDCWLWTGRKTRWGHGDFQETIGGTRRAHRIAWILLRGPINPSALDVCHDCPGGDNPLCCNPAHLHLLSKSAHAQETKRKHQYAAGNQHGLRKHPERASRGTHRYNAKLTDALVREARHLYDTKQCSGLSLARKYGVNAAVMGRVLRREVWRHVPD